MALDPSEGRYRNLLFKLFNRITFEEPLLTVQSVLDIFNWKDCYVMILSKLSALEVALVSLINCIKKPARFLLLRLLQSSITPSTTNVSRLISK